VEHVGSEPLVTVFMYAPKYNTCTYYLCMKSTNASRDG